MLKFENFNFLFRKTAKKKIFRYEIFIIIYTLVKKH